MYFLRRAPGNPTAGSGAPLYALYRRQLHVLPYASDLNAQALPPVFPVPPAFPGNNPLADRVYPIAPITAFWNAYPEVSCRPDFPDPSNVDTAYLHDPANATLRRNPPGATLGVLGRPGRPFLYFNTEYDLAVPHRRSLSYPPNYPPAVPYATDPASPPVPVGAPTPPSTQPFIANFGFAPGNASYRYIIGNRGEPAPLPGPAPGFVAGTLPGDDLILTDVISMNVRVLYGGATDFGDVAVNPGYPFRYFDSADPTSWGPASVPLPPSASPILPVPALRAVEITLRVWDTKTQQARQVTIVQDM
jgi:hypothetical protein